jgi:hypothetical protein
MRRASQASIACFALLLAVAGCAQGGSREADGNAAARRQLPATERVLLGAPDPRAPTQRGVFVKDPRGQIEQIAATGRLVAWSVRTPADRLRKDNGDFTATSPLRLPERSSVVVADERGGAPLTIALGRTWVRRMRMLRAAGGRPQLAIETCTDRKAKRCAAQLVTLTARPLRVADRSTGQEAREGVAGLVDGGRRVIAGPRRGCIPRLSIAALDGSDRHQLPPVRYADDLYHHCTGFERAELHGRYVFAWVDGKSTGRDIGEIDGTTVAALDAGAGPTARWRAVQWPYRYTAGSVGNEIGPGITGSAMYWEELNEDGTTYSLERVALPRDVLHAPVRGKTPTGAEPIAPHATGACDVAATDDAVYELANIRCSPFSDLGAPVGGAINRIVNPVFTPDDD